MQPVPTTAKVTAPDPDPPDVVNVIGVPTVLVRVEFDTVSHSWRVNVVPVVKVKYSTGLVALSYVESAALVAITEHVDACDAVTVVVVGRVHPVPDTE